MPANWKTTALGIATIVAALAGAAVAILSGKHVDMATTTAAISTGIGLIVASDAKPQP